MRKRVAPAAGAVEGVRVTGSGSIESRLRELRARIDDLERTQRELETALDEIDHHMRRVAERLERAAGSPPALEGERRRLRANRALDEREHARNRDRLERLRAEAAALERRRGDRG